LAFVLVYTATPTLELYPLSLHDALPISPSAASSSPTCRSSSRRWSPASRSGRSSTPASTRPPRRSSARASTTSASPPRGLRAWRSEEHTSELQSRENLVCRLLLEKKKKK